MTVQLNWAVQRRSESAGRVFETVPSEIGRSRAKPEPSTAVQRDSARPKTTGGRWIAVAAVRAVGTGWGRRQPFRVGLKGPGLVPRAR
ncbi:hypothetical protein PGTUg99_037042 [Puccinia graminis f. sp. tritici]|uniref:Uncharacterized protein n=1 Tax=Puccinia graminis f. sp. tritici TaxID=56615 RepID=A0A5B0SP11_PUCGR|nr:hypothetical protein PGTUg99_037042 [Puccinia graminis f. sp. tritici]